MSCKHKNKEPDSLPVTESWGERPRLYCKYNTIRSNTGWIMNVYVEAICINRANTMQIALSSYCKTESEKNSATVDDRKNYQTMFYNLDSSVSFSVSEESLQTP